MEIEPLLAEQAKVRQIEAGGDKKSGDYKKSLPQKIVEAIEDKKPKNKKESISQAAQQIGGTNAEYVRKAKKIKRDAPELLEKINEGKINLSQAEKIVGLGGEESEKVLKKCIALYSVLAFYPEFAQAILTESTLSNAYRVAYDCENMTSKSKGGLQR
jgi:hypothetical protein